MSNVVRDLLTIVLVCLIICMPFLYIWLTIKLAPARERLARWLTDKVFDNPVILFFGMVGVLFGIGAYLFGWHL